MYGGRKLTFALIPIILGLAHYLIRVKIFKINKVERSDQGRKVGLWGNSILALIFIIIFIVALADNSFEGETLKWLWMSAILAALGFQALIEWKYQKGTKQYWVPLIVCILGEALVFFLF